MADATPEPLFLYYYKAWVRPVRRGPVDAMNWRGMRLLAENGADLTMPAAADLAEDLRSRNARGSAGAESSWTSARFDSASASSFTKSPLLPFHTTGLGRYDGAS